MRSPDEIMQYIAEIEWVYHTGEEEEPPDECEYAECQALRWVLDRHCSEKVIVEKAICFAKEQGFI